MNTSNFTKIQAVSMVLSLVPMVIYLIAWGRLPEQLQVNIMPNSLYLSRVVVVFVIPTVLAIVNLILTFVIRKQATKENKPKMIWLCFLMPVLLILGSIPLLQMNI